jgi:hypothetical protein
LQACVQYHTFQYDFHQEKWPYLQLKIRAFLLFMKLSTFVFRLFYYFAKVLTSFSLRIKPNQCFCSINFFIIELCVFVQFFQKNPDQAMIHYWYDRIVLINSLIRKRFHQIHIFN